MIQESDNAAADRLRARLGDRALTEAAAGHARVQGRIVPTVATFGSWLRREDGTTAYAVVLGRGIPRTVDPNAAGAAQLRLALGAVDDPARFAALVCVA